ncbi:MAG: hypothetical protein ABIJ61_10600 [bacterium]
MTLYERLLGLDRRWVFLVLAIFVVGPLFLDITAPMGISREVREVFDYVESLQAGDYIVMGFDYDPNALAELEPMAYAILEQCLAKKIKVIALTLSQNGAGMAEQSLLNVVDSTRIYHDIEPVYGEDYMFLGYRPYYAIVILSMGRNFRIPFPQDYYNNPLDSIPMMVGINNYDDVKCVIDFTGSNVADAWVAYGNGAYGVKLAMGMTGVQAADYYPYYQSGQLFGIMGGMKGAAEYEHLAANEGPLANTGPAVEAMKVQIFAHLVIIAFIVVGNIGFFLDKRAKRKKGVV